MKVKYLSETFGTFSSRGIKFITAGDVQEISKEEGQRLIETWPDKFEEVKGTSSKKSASAEKDDSDQLAPVSSDSGANDLLASELNSKIFEFIKSGDNPKMSEIAAGLNLAWQSITSNVKALIEGSLIEKDYENRYSIKG